MYKALQELEFVNTNCRIHLTKSLAQYHKVRTVGGPGEVTNDKCRGLACFLAFDPFEASLKCPPGSARFFDVAEKQGLISSDDASQLSRLLIHHGARMASVYNGARSSFFSETRVRTIIDNVDNLDILQESALAVGSSWADRMYETCPFPLQPEKHLEMLSFRPMTMEGEIEFYSQTPWLAWIEALDLVCMGTWAGFKPATITTMITALEQRVTKNALHPVTVSDELLGRKVSLPMFSRGLQGVVLGIFQDVPKDEMEPILTTLMQFGETLSDEYADLRWKHFTEAIDDALDEDALAREVINVVSPVSKLMVGVDGRRAGYKMAYEHNYWAGYKPLRLDELDARNFDNGFTIAGPFGAEIHIEPVRDISHVNPAFTRMRLESYLNRAFNSIATISTGEALPLRDIQQILEEFRDYVNDPDASIAKLRQHYVVAQVSRHWDKGHVKVTNNELKRFLENLGRDAKHGYQVTSYASEYDKIFKGRVTVTKSRNSLSLSWNKGN